MNDTQRTLRALTAFALAAIGAVLAGVSSALGLACLLTGVGALATAFALLVPVARDVWSSGRGASGPRPDR